MIEVFLFSAIVGVLLLAIPSAIAEDKAMVDPGIFKNWTQYDDLFRTYAAMYSIPRWEILKAIAIVESSLGNDPLVKAGALSADGKSKGLMQFTLPTAQRFGGVLLTLDSLKNDELSIELAAKYISWLLKYFNGDLKKAIISYNQGEGNTLKGRVNDVYWVKWSKAYSLSTGGK